MKWDNSYYTMSDTNIETIWHFLKTCHDKGWLHKGHRCMPWCIRCGTSLSQHELHDSYRDMVHRSVTMHLPLVEREGEYIMVWTTTPWTLAANTALAVHPDLDYAKVQWEGKILYLSKGTLGRLKKGYKELGSVKGKELVGLHYKGPLNIPARKDIELKIVEWNEVGDDEGTGVVHIAPGCGAEDYELSKVADLKVLVPIDESGYYLDDSFGPLYGKRASDVADIVFEHLKENGYLYNVEEYEHRYPGCWRCQSELVFRLVDEWFIKSDEVKEPMKKAAAEVQWTPDYAGMHMQNWLDNMGDWCISRRRFWGLPLPFYPCKECGEINIIGSKKELRERAIGGIETLKELHKPWIDDIKIKCQKCGAEVTRVEDVGDCWLDAGIIPFSTLDYISEDKEYWKKWFPCEFITEMIEQVRLWFYSMLFMSVTLENTAPYKRVLTYSAVVDQKGKPFSKTKGNAIPFDQAAEKMGADIMRWMYAAQNVRSNLRFGYKVAEEVRRKILTFWNVYKFFVTYANLDKPDIQTPVAVKDMPELDAWLWSKLHSYLEVVSARLEDYDSASVVKETEIFWDNLSNWYLRRSRRRFWKSESDKDKASAYYTLYQTLKTITLALAPIMPMSMEYIYQNLVRSIDENAPESVHHNEYPKAKVEDINHKLLKDMDIVMRVCPLGHAARDASHIKVRQPLSKLFVKIGNAEQKEGLERFSKIICDELNVKAIAFVDGTDTFFTYDIKPNLKLLGRKYGKKLGAVREALGKLSPDDVAENVTKEKTTLLELADENILLEPSEILVKKIGKENFSVAEDKDVFVALDTVITDELKAEGAVRDLVRHIQNLRKEADFEVSDRIKTFYQTESTLLTDAIKKFSSYIKQETLSDSLRKQKSDGVIKKTIQLAGDEITIALEK